MTCNCTPCLTASTLCATRPSWLQAQVAVHDQEDQEQHDDDDGCKGPVVLHLLTPSSGDSGRVYSPVAGSALSPRRPSWRSPFNQDRIFWGKFVAMLAMSLAKVLGCDSFPSQSINLRGDWLQMKRIHAVPDSTKVIQFKSIRNWSYVTLVRESVNPDELLAPSFPANAHMPIPLWVGRTFP